MAKAPKIRSKVKPPHFMGGHVTHKSIDGQVRQKNSTSGQWRPVHAHGTEIPPGPSNIVVLTPSPLKTPKDVDSQ